MTNLTTFQTLIQNKLHSAGKCLVKAAKAIIGIVILQVLFFIVFSTTEISTTFQESNYQILWFIALILVSTFSLCVYAILQLLSAGKILMQELPDYKEANQFRPTSNNLTGASDKDKIDWV